MGRLKAYKFRIYLTEEQEEFFEKYFDFVCNFYNLMFDDRKKIYEKVKIIILKKLFLISVK